MPVCRTTRNAGWLRPRGPTALLVVVAALAVLPLTGCGPEETTKTTTVVSDSGAVESTEDPTPQESPNPPQSPTPQSPSTPFTPPTPTENSGA